MKKIGLGIFMWNSPERRTDRYGVFFMSDSTFENDVKIEPSFDVDSAKEFIGTKVRLICVVVQNRKSGHFGDAFLNLKPTMPDVGESVELGVGICVMEESEHSPSGWTIGIKPSDGRGEFWIDPRRFYRLHDQTVELFIESTSDDETPDASDSLVHVNDGKAVSNGDGSIQFKGGDSPIRVKPKIERLPFGKGLFSMSMPNATGNAGEAFEISRED